MEATVVTLHDQSVEIRYPASLQPQIELLFGWQPSVDARPRSVLAIEERGPDRYSIRGTDVAPRAVLTTAELADLLLETVFRELIQNLDTAIALHAAAIGWVNGAVVVAGPTGSGKTSLAGKLFNAGFTLLSDELTLLHGDRTIVGFRRPLVVKPNSDDLIRTLTWTGDRQAVRTSSNVLIGCDQVKGDETQHTPALIIFPHYVAGAGLEMASLSQAKSALKLMECNLNARNLADHGLPALTGFTRAVPAVALTYGDFKQLDVVVDLLTKFSVHPDRLEQLVAKIPEQSRYVMRTKMDAPAVIPEPYAAAPEYDEPKKLTIGMATYDDYDGVYFTIQAIRMYHPEVLDEVEFLIIDNNPAGPASEGLENLKNWIPNYRYVPRTAISGTAVRDYVFREARGEFVLCVDCHILVVAGGLRRLLDYFERNPDSDNLLQGPLIYDDLKTYSTHLKAEWAHGMYGVWGSDPAGAHPDQPPFEIPMQGLGLFACRREAWPGFNPAFRGFGGEEGYIQEKFRQRGGKTLCLPFLRWMHRFHRPRGTPYVNAWEDRVWNYHIGFRELGWETSPIVEHFKTHLGETVWANVVKKLGADFIDPDNSDLKRDFGQHTAKAGNAAKTALVS